MQRIFGSGAAVGLVLALAVAANPADAADPVAPAHEIAGTTNRLAREASPYLQLHKHNPVDWYPWGDEAFERARSEQKPIFLSIGYSTCYWCHVMEREVFSDPEIAALMNANMINIKVDREERPDVDDVYMRATYLIHRSGGWPNSLFLTPDGKPFFAGTYFPPEDRAGRPGFRTVVQRVADAWKNDRARVLETAARVAIAMARGDESAAANSSLDPEGVLARAVDAYAQNYDHANGGFGTRGSKFPRPSILELFIAAQSRNPDPHTLQVLTHTLDAMAYGGMRDQLAGGFHRYSTEPTWSIPHFEKMLYDNAGLLALYARAYELTGRPLYRAVAEDLAAYLEREMTHPDGGFYSAQDAEVGGVEGKSYVWTEGEISTVLGQEHAQAFFSAYRIAPIDEHGGVLRLRVPLAPALEANGVEDDAALIAKFEPDRRKLLETRSQRPQPLRDEKVIAAWNGMAIAALVVAAQALDRPDYVSRAERAAHFVLDRLGGSEGRLRRSTIAGQVREDAVLSDYAFLADGLLALYAATREPEWLAAARMLVDRMLVDFADTEHGGFYMTPVEGDLFLRPRPLEDGAMPSGNAVAFKVLRELAALTGEPEYADAAQRSARVFSASFEQSPGSVATAVLAYANPTTEATPAVTTRASASTPLPRSDDHVKVGLKRSEGRDGAYLVELEIDEGWHVNANPASLAFLVPTSVTLSGAGELRDVRYPLGKKHQPKFARDVLSLYEGTVAIPVAVSRVGDDPVGFAVRYQACDELRCLPPATSRVALP